VIRVLVVDDDFMVAKVQRGFVERVAGFTVCGVAHTGAEALDAARRLRPDLVLLDIYLPDMSGLDVLRKLREDGAGDAAANGDGAGADGASADGTGADVLAVTAARDVTTIRSALRGGVVHYLIKPFSFDTLRDRLERYAVAHHRLAGAGDVAQDDVDRLFGALRPAPASSLPKGLTPPTADLVAGAMRTAGGDLSATECADRVGLSRVSTRRYLEHFVEVGKAAVSLRYGAAGRPERRYRWTAGP
jgi:response regulator of citrate/malate metabolism